MRSAAARAATRRGLSTITVPLHQSSPSKAGATAVVLPAPGGAIRTAPRTVLARWRSAASRSGSTSWIGRRIIVLGISDRVDEVKVDFHPGPDLRLAIYARRPDLKLPRRLPQ